MVSQALALLRLLLPQMHQQHQMQLRRHQLHPHPSLQLVVYHGGALLPKQAPQHQHHQQHHRQRAEVGVALLTHAALQWRHPLLTCDGRQHQQPKHRHYIGEAEEEVVVVVVEVVAAVEVEVEVGSAALVEVPRALAMTSCCVSP